MRAPHVGLGLELTFYSAHAFFEFVEPCPYLFQSPLKAIHSGSKLARLQIPYNPPVCSLGKVKRLLKWLSDGQLSRVGLVDLATLNDQNENDDPQGDAKNRRLKQKAQ